MVNSKYKLLTPDEKKGAWWSRDDYLGLMRVCRTRSDKLYRKLVEDYEFLEGEKFDESLICNKKQADNKRFIENE